MGMTQNTNIEGDNMITEITDIPVYKKSYLQDKIEKINRKAVKMGCMPLELTFDNEHVIEYPEHPVTGQVLLSPLKIEMVTATLNYEIPIIEGYELIAKLDIYPTTDGNSTVLISAVPDKDVPNEYKNADSIHCDHCGWKRNRHHSVLLRNLESGDHIQVGSTCVKDFFGIDPKGFMYMASIKFDNLIGSIDDDKIVGANYGRDIWGYDLDHVLAFSAASTVKWGWLSKSKAWELNNQYDTERYVPTAHHVLDNLNPWPRMDECLKVDIQDEDLELAAKVIEYFKALDPKDNDYLINCCKIVDMGYVPHKYIGYACSMVGAYNREMTKKAKIEKTIEEGQDSNFQGEIGDRIKDIRVTVTYKRGFVNDFGDNTLYAFKDALGNIYKTFYSGYKWECDVDDVVLITGTVKKHNEFKGTKETMLNRVIVNEPITQDDINREEMHKYGFVTEAEMAIG